MWWCKTESTPLFSKSQIPHVQSCPLHPWTHLPGNTLMDILFRSICWIIIFSLPQVTACKDRQRSYPWSLACTLPSSPLLSNIYLASSKNSTASLVAETAVRSLRNTLWGACVWVKQWQLQLAAPSFLPPFKGFQMSTIFNTFLGSLCNMKYPISRQLICTRSHAYVSFFSKR